VFLPGAPPDIPAAVERLVELATRARADGLLALEKIAADEQDAFMKKGLLLVVDGTDPAVMRDILQTDVNAMKERHKAVANWWQTAGVLAPTYGIIGAVVGLIAVLGNLDDPSQLGHGIGAAFV